MVSRIYHLDKFFKIYYNINISVDTDIRLGRVWNEKRVLSFIKAKAVILLVLFFRTDSLWKS